MTSIYQTALGPDFDRLHPKMQERFGIASCDKVAHIGVGVMDEVTRGSAVTVPFLKFGALRNLLFPEHGTEIPFTVANYAYTDRYGRETVTWHRNFAFPKRRRCFDATMIFSEQRQRIVDYLGTRQHMATDLDCWVDDEGGINFTSGDQRFYEGPFGFRFPKALTGHAKVREWWDEAAERYRIRVDVRNPILGHIVGYRGSFTNSTVLVPNREAVPAAALPRREERRE